MNNIACNKCFIITKISIKWCRWSVWMQQYVLEVAGASCWRRASCPGIYSSLHRPVWLMLQQLAPRLCFLPPPQSGRTLWRTLFKGFLQFLFWCRLHTVFGWLRCLVNSVKLFLWYVSFSTVTEKALESSQSLKLVCLPFTLPVTSTVIHPV